MNRWLVALGSSIGLATGFGPVFIFGFGLFQKPMIAEFGWTRAEIAMGFSLATLVAAVLVPFTGAFLDKKGVRPIALTGVVLLSTALALFSQVHSYPAFLAVAAIMGLVGATTSYPTYIPVLPRHFPKRLGVALSIATSGVGAGTAILTPFITALIAGYGWRNALLVLAVTLLPIGLVNVFTLLRDRPKRIEEDVTAEADSATPTFSYGEVLRRPDFWFLTFTFAAVVMVSIGINFQFAALITDRGGTPELAASVLSVSALCVLLARMTTGVLMDYVPPRFVGMALFGAQAIGVLFIATGFAQGPLLFVAAALLGWANGGEGDLIPYALSRKYGKRAYGRVYGTCFAFFNLGTLVGPILMALCFDRFQTYTPMLFAFACVSSVAALTILITGSVLSAPRIARTQGVATTPG